MKPTRGGLLSAIGAALLLLALSPAISWATYPGSNGRIAYVRSAWDPNLPARERDSEIFTSLPAGGDPTQLTDNSRVDLDPSWSADGRRIVFSRWDGHDMEIWTMRADGTHQRQVTDDQVHQATPRFTPSGSRIIMISNYQPYSRYEEYGNIVTVRPDGTDRVRILGNGRRSKEAQYSPSGRWIVFAGAARKTGTRFGIWKMRRNGSHLRLLARSGDEWHELWRDHPDFSPDGSHIVYQIVTRDYHYNRYDTALMRSNGRFKHVTAQGYHEPAFSPDGTRIAVMRSGSCDIDLIGSTIFTVALDGSDPQGVSPYEGDPCEDRPPYNAAPSWQPMPMP